MLDQYTRIGYFTAQPSSLDPFHGFDPDSYSIIMASHDSLTFIGGNGEILPGLATSWKKVGDTCFEFELRKGVKFHNEEEFNAFAVQTTIHAQRDPKNNSPTGLGILGSILNVEIIDDYKILIHTAFPDCMLPWRLAMFSAIVPPQLLLEKGVDIFADHPVGTGPFVFESMQKGKEISFKVNPNYWGKIPETKGLKFICMPAQYWATALKDDMLDLVYGVHEVQLPLIQEDANLQIHSRLSALSHWFLLSSKGVLQNKKIRLALNYAIDNYMIAKIYTRENSVPQRCVGTEGQFGYNPNVNCYPFDPDKAKLLLKEAGYENGFVLKGIVADHSASIVQMIAAYLADIGIILEFDIVPRTVWMDMVPNSRMTGKGIYSGDFAVAPVDNPIMYTGFHHYIFLASDGPFSIQDYPEYQQKFISAMTELDPLENERKLKELDMFVNEEAYLLFTVQSSVVLASRKDISMEISNNGHLDTYSWLSLKNKRQYFSDKSWNFDYKEITETVDKNEFQLLLRSTEYSNMFWLPKEQLQDKNLNKLANNLQYLELVKLNQEKLRFRQIIQLLHKVRDMEGLMEASRFSGIATFNMEGEILLFNQTYLQLMGEGIQNRRISELFLKENTWADILEEIRLQGGFFGSIDCKKINSEILPAQASCTIRSGGVGEPIGYLLILRDETKERELQSDLERSYLELERKVIERTTELKKTLDEVQELKKKQDGDYFLTSLLLQPLSRNEVISSVVNIEFFIHQQKQFGFKEKQYELGGDINIARNIFLGDRSYVLFVNADAMGKSIQGAGGAIVFGSVFRSIIERLLLNPKETKVYPERWLKNTLKEMNQVFLSFDGYMLISLVIGLIDENNGFLYYVNIEHPEIVLYRDGKASFLKSNDLIRKLGTSQWDTIHKIETFQLYSGDVILCGSDGRDDIEIGLDSSGNRIINEDEKFFLQRVEEGEGNIEKIVSALHKNGQLIDDLSLLRVGYKEDIELNQMEVINENWDSVKDSVYDLYTNGKILEAISTLERIYFRSSDSQILTRLINLLLKEKMYLKVISILDSYLYLHPQDNQMLFVCSYCYKKVKEYEKAIDLGERLRSREPKKVNNLLNLAELYYQVSNLQRAKFLLDEISYENQIDPKVQTYYRKIQKKLDTGI